MKKLFFLLIILFCANFVFAQNLVSDSQLLQSGHWLYDSMYRLSMESKTALHLGTTPISVAELKSYLATIDENKLSEYGKTLYKKVSDYLYSSPKDNDLNVYANVILNPEFYIRTNDNIITDNKYFYKDHAITFPLIVGYGDLFTLQADPFLGVSYIAQQKPDCKMNIPLDFNLMEWELPTFSYFNFAKDFGKWGLDFQLGKRGLTIGKTQMGSVIYNDTFETDLYTQTSLFSKGFKYTLGFAEVDYDKYLYLHQFYFKPFNCLNFTIVEGGLNHGNIALKNLNPFLLLHNLFSADIYIRAESESNQDLNLANHYCAYLGLAFDFYPIKNMRVYMLYSMTENQSKTELESGLYGKLLPNGRGIQGGIDYNIPTKNKNLITTNIEAVYTASYLYLKQSPKWSLIKIRHDKHQGKDVNTWIGLPYGPDTAAFNAKIGYEYQDKWQISLNYRLVMQGEMNAKTLTQTYKYDADGDGVKEEYPAYYPSTEYYLGKLSKDEAVTKARNAGLSGVIEYKNQIALECGYNFTEKLSANAKFLYNFVYNTNNVQDNFQSGLDASFAVRYNVF